MRIMILVTLFLYFVSPVAFAKTAVEGNQETIKRILFGLVEDQIFTQEKEGNKEITTSTMYLDGLTVSFTIELEKGSQPFCGSMLETQKNKWIFLDDFGCDGVLDRMGELREESKFLEPVTPEQYGEYLKALELAVSAASKANDDEPGAGFTLVYDVVNITATWDHMAQIVRDVESMVGPPKTDLLYLKYFSAERMIVFAADYKSGENRYEDCRYEINSNIEGKQHKTRYFLDENCDGAFEYFSSDGKMFEKSKDEGSFVAKMMRDLMLDMTRFVEAQKAFSKIEWLK